MQFNPEKMAPRDVYKLLTGLVVPRPIALVTTLSASGVVNAAPFSFFNVVGSDPPLVVFAPGVYSPHSHDNIRANGEFVVNLVSEDFAHNMNVCAVDFPDGISELDAAGLTTEPSARIAVPRIAQSPASLECREHTTLSIGRNRLVIGEVVFLHVRDEIVDENLHISNEKLALIGRLAGGGYTRTQDTFEIPRLNYEEWQKSMTEERR